MAKVSLRIYNREIETMVDRGQLDEAIAHCRHILNTFPKNLETYRLLGKAYLEARRYDEATDIFERLLMAVPDDFVAHVGMSIIDDEQNNLDASIWHMQRAFEVQPSNAAIQGELQRLFGRRDGVEPPKVRLTRGALAHMYVQGELYPQAISEIKAVLEEDHERQDMQVLLARAYFHAGQKNEAAEVCSQLLRRYPYCFDANRVLVELLPETERGESPQVYRHRVDELDPYATFATGSVFRAEEVSDAAVSLERLEWDGQPVDLGQEWRESLGIGLTDKSAAGEEEPDWLKTGLTPGSFGASVPSEEPASVSGSEDEIPDFLRDAGWGKDTGTFKEGPGTFDTSEESPEEPALAEGDLPDWIKAMAPTGADVAASSTQDEIAEDLAQTDVPDWLQGLGGEQEPTPEEQPLEEGDLPDWLAAMKPGGEPPQEPKPEEPVMAAPGGDEDLPDWLAEMKAAEEAPQESQPEETVISEPSSDEGLPGWLADMKDAEEAPQEPQPEETVMAAPGGDEEPPDWLADMKAAEEPPQEPGPEETVIGEPSSDEEGFPSWLADMKAAEEAPQEPGPEETVIAEPSGDEGLPGWLADMKAAEEAPQEPGPEETVIAEPGSDEGLPDWLRSIQAEEDKFETQEMSAEAPQEPVQEFQEMTGESLSDWQINDEELAGAVPEERAETEPDWVQQARAAGEQEIGAAPAPQEEPLVEPSEELPGFLAEMQVEPTEAPGAEIAPVDAGAVGPSAAEQDDAIAWLESLAAKHGAKPEELVTDPNARKETAPEWVQKAAEAALAAQPPAEGAAPMEEPVESIPEWTEPAREEPGLPQAELEETQPQEPVSPAGMDETGMWLRDLGEEAGAVSEQEPAAEAEVPAMSMDEGVPDWLREMEAGPSKEEAAPASKEGAPEVPDWLLGMETEPTATERFPVFPSEAETTFEPGQEAVSKIDLNTASTEELAELPGIGDYLAENIVAYREIYGAFSSVDDLNNIAGIDSETIEGLRGRVEIHEVEAAAQAGETDLSDWLQGIETEEAGAEAAETVAEEAAPGDLPSWLAGLEEEQARPEPARGAEEELPEWLRAVEEQEPVQAEPTAPTDWQPAEIPGPFAEEPAVPVVEPEPEVEEPPVEVAPPPPPELEPEPEAEPPSPEPEPYIEPVTRVSAGMLSAAPEVSFAQAQSELTSGNLPGAIQGYERLIRKGKMLDEIIFDLREAQYQYPVDVSVLQALGDAYMRANRLQDALDAYTKAEELLR